MRDKSLYAETYRKPGLKVRDDLLPTLPHIHPCWAVVEVRILKAGRLERGEDQLEFQDLRVFLVKR